MLNNIDHEFVSEAPFLIEERLQGLFKYFLRDLTSTVESIPSSILQHCVSNLHSTIASSVKDLVRNEILPSLFQKVMSHVSEFTTTVPTANHVSDNWNDKFDSLRDIMLGVSSVQESKLDDLASSISHVEHMMRDQLFGLKHKISEKQMREKELLEQMKRRLGDIASIASSIKQKVNSTPEEKKVRNSKSPHVLFNNPLVQESPLGEKEDHHSPRRVPIFTRTPSGNHSTFHTTSPMVFDIPQWQKEFPYINHDDINIEVRKELWKSIPKTSEWENFSGELPYNHEIWLKNIDVFVQDYYILDHMIISRLTALFTDTAKNWYIGIRDSNENRSWAWWKNTIASILTSYITGYAKYTTPAYSS
jgi:hypothetical protein